MGHRSSLLGLRLLLLLLLLSELRLLLLMRLLALEDAGAKAALTTRALTEQPARSRRSLLLVIIGRHRGTASRKWIATGLSLLLLLLLGRAILRLTSEIILAKAETSGLLRLLLLL